MTLKKVRQVKQDNWFCVWDLIIYGAVIALTVVLFLVIILRLDKTPTDGVRLYYKGEAVCEYYYSTDRINIIKADNIEVEENGEEYLNFTFYTDGKSGYNKVAINKKLKSVSVTDADCSLRKDCVYTPAITNNTSYISCPPHNFSIEPITRAFIDDGYIIVG